MAIEPRRGCGFRQVGGTYLVGGKLAAPCGKLPAALTVCPSCGAGVKPARGWTWIIPLDLFALDGEGEGGPCPDCGAAMVRRGETFACLNCGLLSASSGLEENRLTLAERGAIARNGHGGAPLCYSPLCYSCKLGGDCFEPGERAGLLWVGERFYATPELFTAEADCLGISRRIRAVPGGFELGKTWVFLAHARAIKAGEYRDFHTSELKTGEAAPGAFAFFLPQRIERLITQSQADAGEAERLQARGITAVVVPDNDADHNAGAEGAEQLELA